MQYQVPKYVSPKQAAEDKARRRRMLFWILVAIPLAFAFIAWGYSDQAPAGVRSAIIALDRSLGFPFAWLLSMVMR
jgi:hypothetical protein